MSPADLLVGALAAYAVLAGVVSGLTLLWALGRFIAYWGE